MAPERRRSARDYEQALRRQELAAGRALVAALPTEGTPGTRELAAARRVLTQSLFELRRLGRELDDQIESLHSRQGPGRPGQGRPAPARGGGPGELDRFQAVRDAVEEVAERWEGRRDQLGAELDRRQPNRRQGGQRQRQPGQSRGPGQTGQGHGRGPGQTGQGPGQTGQGPGQARGRRAGQPATRQGGQGGQARGQDRERGEGRGRGRGRGGVAGRDGVRNRGAAAPARPERPRSPRSRRSPG